MKRIISRTAALVLVVATLGVSAPLVASAGASSARSGSAAVSVWRAFQLAWQAYVDELRSINLAYRSSVASARAREKSSLSVATTKVQRRAARATLSAAMGADLNARDAAVVALGDPPAPPAGYLGTAYVQGFQAANEAYRASVVAAESTFAATLSAATTAAQRQTARVNLKIAVAKAAYVRAEAILALGAPPKSRA